MNIAVINIKDIIRYVFKIGIVIFLICIFVQLINKKNAVDSNLIKKEFENKVQKLSDNNFVECLDTSMALFSYKKTNENNLKILSNKQILAMGTGLFDKSILNKTDLVIDENELTLDDKEELASQIEDIPEDETIEEVTENNITANFTTSFGTVKINNQSNYELTQEILLPDAEITNKNEVLIYHTHTCESYTPSERI